MSNKNSSYSPEIHKAFQDWDRIATITNFRIACYLGIVLMPAGVILDQFVYPQEVKTFLGLRLFSSVLIGGFLAFLMTAFAKRHYRMLGVLLAMLPFAAMSVMIGLTEGPSSTYYAGLNLVLLVVGFVMHWTVRESLIAVALGIVMYVTACLIHLPLRHFTTPYLLDYLRRDHGAFFNNIYFLVLTGIIVVTGRYFHSQLRFREFALRYELDKSRSLLAENNEKLMELDQIKNRFFANISHELRTPLTLLLSPLESMMHAGGSKFDPQTRNLFTIMQANGMRLLKLINDLLDLVRLESGRMEVKREPIEMTAFIRSMINAAQQMADDKKLKLETAVQTDLGPLMVDGNKLEKTMLNLIFNALKFTPANGTVTVRVVQKDEWLVLTVEDTGVGIAEKNLPFVFDRFWQADNSSKRKYQGVGIGLSLVKELTEVQGGSVSVTSVVDQGTTFTVKLPYIKSEGVPAPVVQEPVLLAPAAVNQAPVEKTAEAPAPQSEEWLTNLYRRAELFPAITHTGEVEKPAVTVERTSDQPRLLVADDEPDMLRFLNSQLESHYEVIQATDGALAVQKSLQTVPDIILLDYNMPEKDGLQVCRELRQLAPTREIPIIILTARADEETKLAALSAGANDFLSKPFSTSELHVRVRNLVDSHYNKEKLAKQNRTLEQTIEQLKETETLLVQTEKMASLGRMSAGIMHEINNPLNYASTGLFTLQRKQKFMDPSHQEEYAEVISEVEEGLSRVKSIVSDLKSFTRTDVDQFDRLEVVGIVNAALRFLSSEWKEKVQIDQRISEKLQIKGNRNKLLQVFINLFQNALDAMRHKTYSADEKPVLHIEERVEGDKVILLIRDNGEGIDPTALNKVFDPFFTTKDVGEGMGLGLTICYRIVKEHEGRISVASERGKYCEFRLEFPGVAPSTKPVVPEPVAIS